MIRSWCLRGRADWPYADAATPNEPRRIDPEIVWSLAHKSLQQPNGVALESKIHFELITNPGINPGILSRAWPNIRSANIAPLRQHRWT